MSGETLSVRMRCSTWPQLIALHRRDLARGQLFLRSANAPKPGTNLRIQLLLPSGSAIELVGVVSVVVGDTSERGAGAVVALEPLAPAHKLTLTAALKALNERTKRTTAKNEAIAEAPPANDDALSLDDGRAHDEAAEKLLMALRTELSTFAKLNAFQILGVGYAASDDEVRVAFAELSKRYHPDRYVRYQSEAISQIAEELFVRAREAYKQTATSSGRALVLDRLRNPGGGARSREPSATAQQRPTLRRPITGGERAEQSLAHAPTETPSGTERQEIAPAIVVSQVAPTRHLGGEKIKTESGRPPSKADTTSELDPLVAFPAAEALLAEKRFTDAAGLFTVAATGKEASDAARAGVELAEGLRALEAGDRMEAAQRFEAVLDLHPANEVAARELAKMRRRATDQRQGLLAKLMKDGG